MLKNTSVLYAAYGSNLHPERLRQRVPSASLLGKATIESRALRFHKRSSDGSAKCNIVASKGEIHVAVYEMAVEHKPKLDQVEGVGVGYRIETLSVTSYGECFTYVATETHVDESLSPYSWYKELVIVGCEYLQFPRHYVNRIVDIQSSEDSNRERHARHMSIVHKARNGT